MPTPTYTPLATVTLGTAAASVTFSSIPATYRDLVLNVSVRSDRADTVDYLALRLNADSDNNYTFVTATASDTGGITSSAPAASNYMQGLDIIAATGTANVFTSTNFSLMDYSATDKHKTALARSSAPGTSSITVVSMFATRWASTSAVTSIVLSVPYNSAQLAAGSTFNLYGIAS